MPHSASHALLKCMEAFTIQFASPLGLHIIGTDSISFKQWLLNMLEELPEDALQMLFSLVWAIWKRRNVWVFGSFRMDEMQVIHSAAMVQQHDQMQSRP